MAQKNGLFCILMPKGRLMLSLDHQSDKWFIHESIHHDRLEKTQLLMDQFLKHTKASQRGQDKQRGIIRGCIYSIPRNHLTFMTVMAWNTSFLSLTVTSYGTSSWGAGSPPKVMSPSSGRLKRRIFFRSSPKFSLRSTGTALTSTCWHKSGILWDRIQSGDTSPAYFGTEFNQVSMANGQFNSGQTLHVKLFLNFGTKQEHMPNALHSDISCKMSMHSPIICSCPVYCFTHK